MKTRTEFDSMGAVEVPAEHRWGAQTQRSFENFKIGTQKQPLAVIHAFAHLKAACAMANMEHGLITPEQAETICAVCKEIADGRWDSEFPLAVWQTGSGTQTNMNVNEVIAHLAAERGVKLHPNDDVNRSQSSNDTYPTAMYIAAVTELEEKLIPSCEALAASFAALEARYPDIIKIGRTHLQDAVPLRFAQEVSGWRRSVEAPCGMIKTALPELKKLAVGGTAVGTGLNAPADYDECVCGHLNKLLGSDFTPDRNKFHALTSRDALVFAHGAMKALASNLMKTANDVRWLAAGPRCGLSEISIPANEPGSSIMPGKVNPTQCEAVTMVAVQVMANDVAVGLAASQGNFQLNVFMPVCIDNFLRSVRLLTAAIDSFRIHCLAGLTADRERMAHNLHASLMTVTALTPYIGYENAARVAKLAHRDSVTLRDACLSLGYMTAAEFDRVFHPEQMV